MSKMTVSNTFETNDDKRLIGLYLLQSVKSQLLCKGMTCARCQLLGEMPERIQMLNSLDEGSAKTRIDSFKILLPIWSGPVALFIFKVFKILKTLDDSTVLVSMLVLQKRGR